MQDMKDANYSPAPDPVQTIVTQMVTTSSDPVMPKSLKISGVQR